MTQQWVKLTKVFSGLEADTIKATLELEGIPALVRGFGVGIFGSSFQGPVTNGIEILVPESLLDEARGMISADDDLAGDDHPEDDPSDE